MAEIYSTGQKSTDSLKGGLKFEQDNNRIIGRDINNIPSLSIYSDPSGTGFAMKVSKPTFDVLTATDDELIFNSNQNTFKISDTLTGNIPTANLSTNNTQAQTNLVTPIPHGITGRIPAFLAYVQLSGATYCLMPYTATDIFGSVINNRATRSYSATADGTNIYIILQATQVTTTNTTIAYGGEPVKIYILQETAN